MTSRALRWLRNGIALFALTVGLFMAAAWIGSSIPRNGDWREADSGVAIMVETNGVHTAIIVPLVTPQKDWRGDFPVADISAPNRPYTHISISWGEREVFLNTPRWRDLRPVTIAGAMFGGEGLLHIAHYIRPAPSDTARTMVVTEAEYSRLVRAIEEQIVPPGARNRHSGYGDYDIFYEAPGNYHIGNTCNQWTSDTLAAAGIRIGWWTPFAGGVMKWIEPYAPLDNSIPNAQ